MEVAYSFILRFFFFFKQKTAYEIKECDWSSDVCSSDLLAARAIGSVTRSGLYNPWSAACPRAHKRPWLMGDSGLPSSLITRPSRTLACSPHPAAHSRHVVA